MDSFDGILCNDNQLKCYRDELRSITYECLTSVFSLFISLCRKYFIQVCIKMRKKESAFMNRDSTVISNKYEAQKISKINMFIEIF